MDYPKVSIDYPNVRASATCPLCHNAKDDGVVMCWPCYRRHDARNGLQPCHVAILTATETALAEPNRCTECGHVRLNPVQASACCTMQGDDCPECRR